MRIVFFLVSFVFIISCGTNNNKQRTDMTNKSEVSLQEEVLHIGKMHCEMCVASVEKGLKSVEGVEFVNVILEDSTAIVRYDSSLANKTVFKDVIEKRGYVLKDN